MDPSTISVKVISKLAPSFYRAYKDIVNSKDTDPASPTYGKPLREYWFKGGRGSTKSSAISIFILLHIILNSLSNAVVFVKVAENIRDSVYKQIRWAIGQLGLDAYFRCTTSPFRCAYSPTGNFSNDSPDVQEIIFRGLDKAGKIKGIKPIRGYFDQIWFEELTEFTSLEEIRSVIQSVIRGDEDDDLDEEEMLGFGWKESEEEAHVDHPIWQLFSYNPPPTVSNWVNEEADVPVEGRKVYSSNYLSVNPHWLGREFFKIAEQLKKRNLRAYMHEYMGVVTGTGGNVFNNLEIRDISDDEIETKFNNRLFGIDWGFSIDPFVWGAMHFDPDRQILYIFDEIYHNGIRTQLSADMVAKKMAKIGGRAHILADCAEPDSIADFNAWGIPVDGCPKPHGANWSGRDYEIKALSELNKIVIDPRYAPNAVREFKHYEYEKNAKGQFYHAYPKHEDHWIDCARYATFFALRKCGLLKC